MDLREKLDEGILVGDGVIGTLLADRRVAQPYGVRQKLALVGGVYLIPSASMPHPAGDVVEAVS